MARSKGRNAVLIVRVPDDWKPCSLNAIPLVVLSAEFFARRMPLWKAVVTAEGFNRARLPGSGAPDGQWALTVANCTNQRRARKAVRA